MVGTTKSRAVKKKTPAATLGSFAVPGEFLHREACSCISEFFDGDRRGLSVLLERASPLLQISKAELPVSDAISCGVLGGSQIEQGQLDWGDGDSAHDSLR